MSDTRTYYIEVISSEEMYDGTHWQQTVENSPCLYHDEKGEASDVTHMVAALRAENERLRRWRCEADCRYTMGDVAETSGSHCPTNRPCARCEAEGENERLRADLEQARGQLAVCGVIAMCNTEDSLRGEMPAPGAYGYSVSLAEVERAVRREIALRAAAREALAALTRLADSAAYWANNDVPVGIVAEVDAAKARLAGVLNV